MRLTTHIGILYALNSRRCPGGETIILFGMTLSPRGQNSHFFWNDTVTPRATACYFIIWLYHPEGNALIFIIWLCHPEGNALIFIIWLCHPEGNALIFIIWLCHPEGNAPIFIIWLYHHQGNGVFFIIYNSATPRATVPNFLKWYFRPKDHASR